MQPPVPPPEDVENCTRLLGTAMKSNGGNLLRALHTAFGSTFMAIGFVCRMTWLVAAVTQVIMLKKLLSYSANADSTIGMAIFFAIIMGLSASAQSIAMNNLIMWNIRSGVRARSSISALMYDKLLSMSLASLRGSTSTGAVMNMFTNDTRRVVEGYINFHFLWSGVVEIIVIAGFLIAEVQVSALSGVAVLIVMIPMQVWFANAVGKIQAGAVKCTDERTRTMEEVLKNILLIKLSAWETNFMTKVAGTRAKEMSFLRSSMLAQAVNVAVFFTAPVLAAAAIFAVHTVALGKPLDTVTAFAVLAWTNVIMRTLVILPRGAAGTAEALVSIRRLEKFLNLANTDWATGEHARRTPDDPAQAIVIQQGSFSWSSMPDSPPVLRDINLVVPTGSLSIVVGSIAAGKSSLLSSLLGETHSIGDGFIAARGPMSFVPQRAWILNMSFKENICFGLPFDEARFVRVVTACALLADIAMLPDGIDTEIGESGTTLSGGQKQRVSLARACYRDAQVYLLDDVLSALDTNVAQQVFKQVLDSETGLLRDKTRVLVTHTEWCLPSASQIIVMKDGRVDATGSFQELTANGANEAWLAALRGEAHVVDSNTAAAAAAIASASAPTVATAAGTAVPSEPNAAVPPAAVPTSVILRGAANADGPRKLVQAEERGSGGVQGRTYLQYAESGGGVWSCVLLMLLFTFSQFVRLVSDWWIGRWSINSYGLEPGTYAWIYAVIALGYTLLIIGRTMWFTNSMLLASSVLHNTMFARVLRAPMRFFWTTPTGRIINRFSKDIDVLDKLLGKSATDLFNFAFIAFGSLVTVLAVFPWLLVVMVPLFAVFTCITRFFLVGSRQLRRLDGSTRSPLFQFLSDTMAGLESVRVFDASQRLRVAVAASINANASAFFYFWLASRWLGTSLDSLSALLITGVGLYIAGSGSTSDAGVIGLALVQSLQVTGLFQFAVRQAAETENYMTSVERVAAYAHVPQEPAPLIPATAPASEWPQYGVVSMQQVVMKYHDDLEPALRGVTFCTKPREKIGIVGRTGSGKSSLGMALFRIVDVESGHISVDGVDTSVLGLQTLRRALCVVPQDPILFHGTLRANLDPFDEHTDDALYNALRRVHMDDAVHALPLGIHTMVAEKGENFSVGQRQLLCLCRALLQSCRIVYLDEATSNVDAETDELIQNTIRREFASCTVLTVAHRLNTVIDCDRVLVMDKGVAVEFSPPIDLLDNPSSVFSSLVEQTGPEVSARLRSAAAAAKAAAAR